MLRRRVPQRGKPLRRPFCFECLEARRVLAADYLEQIGWTALQAALGPEMPTGIGVTVAQVEHREQSIGGYAPDLGLPDFAGKTITLESGASIDSQHASRVGQHLYGTLDGVAPAIEQVSSWEVGDWADRSLLVGSGLPPAIESHQLQNHSWNGSTASTAADLETLRRLDFQVNRDNTFVAIALGNQGTQFVPRLLNASYNGMSVGLSNGTSNYGLTAFDGNGRTKPEIVAPESHTSQATPQVSGAAALLIDAATRQNWSAEAIVDAQQTPTIKAILMAGASKAPFPQWSRTAQRPLDPKYGSGELNVYDSYYILASGEQSPGNVAVRGWDWGQTAAIGGNQTYTFTVPAGSSLTELSIALTWNRIIASTLPGGFGNLTSSLANLDLQLSRIGAGGATTIDVSTSTVDNVEYLYQRDLQPGTYQLVVTSNQPQIAYGLAWNGLMGNVASPLVGTHLFYNNSGFDGNDPAAGAADDLAIALDKTALLPGAGPASFANYTSYSRGINGLMIDVSDLPGIPSLADVEFRVGNDNSPALWALAPAPQAVSYRPGQGADGSDRVELIWADGAIQNEWLQVTLKATANTGLSQPIVFYYGNSVGESGDSANALVNSTDELGARNNPRTFLDLADVTDAFDYDRNGFVNATDQILARSNANTLATSLVLINVPSGSLAAAAVAPTVLSDRQAVMPGTPSQLITTDSAVANQLQLPLTPRDVAIWIPYVDQQHGHFAMTLAKASPSTIRRLRTASDWVFEQFATDLTARRLGE